MPEKIKVALVGLGNCFSGLIQGIEYYSKNPSQKVTGIIHENLRDYTIHDIDFVAGFDVGANKVGKPINDAIYESPNMVNWIDKNTDHNHITQLFRLTDKVEMTLMQIAHGWHKTNGLTSQSCRR